MNQDHLYFEIDQKNMIRFDLQTEMSDVFRYVEIEVFLSSEGKDIIVLFDDFLIVGLREFRSALKLILGSNPTLHPSVTKNIGYLWNECLHDVDLPMELDAMGNSFWVGQKYMVWNAIRSHAATWLYEKNGKYYLEVTPDYPWHFSDPKEGEKFISYEEFMLNYKPIAIFEVSRDTLESWLKKVTEFIPVVEANDSKFFIKKD